MPYNLDQSYTTGQDNDDAGTGVGKLRLAANNNTILAQSFTVALAGPINRFTPSLLKRGSPTGNVWIEIHADGADPTVSTLLGTSANVDVSTIGSSYADVNFDFTNIPAVVSTKYWALLKGDYTESSSNAIVAGIDTSSPSYSGGNYGRYGNGSAAWEDISTYDMLFKQYSDDAGSPSASLSPSASVSRSVSPSSSLSPSSSISASVSPSASRSPSSSASPSLSPSASRSPSASISPSASRSPSASQSLSPSSSLSSSISASASPSGSASPSFSPSASPSLGYSLYSRGEEISLPTDDNDLDTIYTDQEENKVKYTDQTYVDQAGGGNYILHQFKNFIAPYSFCSPSWQGKCDLAPNISTVYLQVYNYLTHLWETIDTDSSAHADVDFLLVGKVSDTTNYKSPEGFLTGRVYQLAT